MTNYTKTTNFATKDTLPSGNANKIVKGTEIDTEFNNIATAVATKADTAGPTFTGTVTIPTVDLNGGAIDGTTVGASTAAAITGTTIVANTSINIAGDGATVTGIKDEDDMSSNSATKLATQQSIKAYVDSQITAQDLDFQADSGGALSIDLDSETLTFTGGTGVDTSGSGNAVTFAIDSTVATLTGTQTLTNKTLTSPTLNTPTIGTSFTIGSATITEAELEILDGATVTTAELNVLDGITSTTAELNILDGVTSTAAELNILDGVTSTAAELNILDGVTSTAAELNILDGVTSTTAELNILDGVTATTAELNYVDGVTSAIQTQIDAKAPLASPTFTGTVTVPGLTTTADVSFGDNDKAIFGAGSDLQIYHDGSHSYVSDQGTGNIKILADDFILKNSADTETMIQAFTDAAVSLWYDNSAKLATTSTGIDVTGTVTADGLTVDTTTLVVDATNDRVGIGTSSPSTALHVVDSGNPTITLSGSDGAYTSILDLKAAGGGGSVISANGGSNSLIFNTNSSEAMRIDSSGNVGIGSTNADAKFKVELKPSGTVLAGLRIGYNSTSANYFDGDTQFFRNGAGTSEHMRIDSSGRVNIGGYANSQGYELEVVNDTNANTLLLHREEVSVGVVSTLGFQGTQANDQSARFAEISSEFDASWGGDLVFSTKPANGTPNNTVSERMRIDSSGDLLLGTTSASGTSGQGIKLRKVSSDGVLHIVGATSTTAQDALQVYSTGASAYRFLVQYNGQVNATSSSINAISDASLKQNIRDLDKGLEAILALQPRRFDWINGDGNDIMGFVAQEVETVLPELVHDYKYSEEETKLGLKMGDMIPTLVKAIQEQQETITALTARITQLENN